MALLASGVTALSLTGSQSPPAGAGRPVGAPLRPSGGAPLRAPDPAALSCPRSPPPAPPVSLSSQVPSRPCFLTHVHTCTWRRLTLDRLLHLRPLLAASSPGPDTQGRDCSLRSRTDTSAFHLQGSSRSHRASWGPQAPIRTPRSRPLLHLCE